ncbi:MAG: hypothetical protein LJE64_09405 [Desulfofustis sp.]|jgi:hypothetical protein|nr:hypothetical protein [Desulfofustis sp.]
MDLSPEALLYLWQKLIWPLIRLLLFISIGLIAANILESLNWTRRVAALARPLVRFGHLSEQAGAAFSVAIVSGVAANTMLSEAFDKGQITRKELVLANLFNALPTYFLHLPTVIVITAPLIKSAAFIYVGITFSAALLRTLFIVVVSRMVLPEPEEPVILAEPDAARRDWAAILNRTWKRVKGRMRKILIFTVPIYSGIFVMNRLEFFSWLESVLAGYLSFIPWLSPQAMGIIALHLAAELTAGLAAAGALLQDGILNNQEVIIALLIGNILSSPLRAVRHQLPYYAGIFKPRLAMELIIYSQSFRILSLILAALIYFTLAMS